MKLNPTKYAFRVSAGKFLSFIVNIRGIEANPNKIKAVIDMKPPSNTKEIQRQTGRIEALSRFVFRSSDKCQPFFKVLKKAFHWDAHYEEVFISLKNYLRSHPPPPPPPPPLLVSPSEGELLTFYFAISDFLTSVALVRQWDNVQQLVY